MKKSFVFFLFLPFSIFVGLIILYSFPSKSKAERASCPPEPPAPSCNFCSSYAQTQYRCQGNCPEAKIQERKRICYKGSICTPSPITDENGCIIDWECKDCRSCDGCDPWEDPVDIENCHPWQDCGSRDWSFTKNKCQCAGSCLEKPKNPRYYDNPEHPSDPFNPESSKDPNNIYLPVKLDWDDVKGWKDGWKEMGEIKTCSEECVQSYVVRIENTNKNNEGNYYKTNPLDKSEYNYRDDPNAGACLLKSEFAHTWYVKACCNPDGTNCGPENNFQFKTNAAPELIEPADPDWNGTSTAENIPLPVTLKWCRVEKIDNQDVYSYNLFPFVVENGEDKCHPSRQSGEVCVPITLPSPPVKLNYIEYYDEVGLFTKLSSYAWRITACKTLLGEGCSDYSQRWRFKTGEITLKEISWFSPPDGSIVGFPVILEWKPPWGARSFQYELYKGTFLVVSGKTTDLNIEVTSKLDLDTEYKWRVKVCWDYEAKDCEEWPKEWWHFKTTGAPPNLNYPADNSTNIPIPTNFDWEDVPGANSYRYQISSDSSFINIVAEMVVEKSEVSIDYPKLKQLTDYWWRVKTCADKDGNVCGEWSSSKFKTFKLSKPINPSPVNNEEIFTYQMPKIFSWDSVLYARYYKYLINYTEKSSEEVSEECKTGKLLEKIVSNNSDLVSLNCLGKYQWQVQACLDEKCEEAGDLSSIWTFTLSQRIPPGKGGLVPCGRDYDDPATPWNERESCQIKHLFLLLRNILDFLFLRIGSIILILLVIITGIIYYFSVFSPEIFGEWAAISNVRSLWKYAGIGYGVIFLAWLIINLFLAILGYKFQIFGRWWEIGF